MATFSSGLIGALDVASGSIDALIWPGTRTLLFRSRSGSKNLGVTIPAAEGGDDQLGYVGRDHSESMDEGEDAHSLSVVPLKYESLGLM